MHTFESKTNKTTLVKNLVALFLIFIGTFNVGFGQTDNLTCTAGTIVGTQIFFNTTNFAVVHEKGSDSNFASYSPWRVYTGNTVTFTGGANVLRITSVVITAESTTYATAAVNGTLTILSGTGTVSGSSSANVATITVTGSDVKSIRLKPNAQTRWSSITINYELISTCTAPTTQATSATFSTITNNSMNLSWTSGNGNGRIVVMKEASAVSGTPTSGNTYTANAAFGSGSFIATNEFVVYNGNGNSVSVSGLACGKTYHVKVYEYNTTDVCYNTTSPASASASTLITAAPSAPNYTQTCGSTTFASIPNTTTESTFWQTSATGTIETDPANVTKTVSSTTTLFLRTKSSTGCWSNATAVSPTLIFPPVITTQPVNQNAVDGGSATFSTSATNGSGFQWQTSTDGGTNWNNISGATNASLTVSSLTLAMDGYKYRVIVTAASPCSDVVSNVGTLSVVSGPCVQENFSNIASSSSYSTKIWLGTGGSWTATDAREDQSINGKAITFKGSVTSPSFSAGIGNLTITTKYPFSGDETGTITIKINGAVVGSVPVSTSSATYTINNIDISGNIVVLIENDNGSKRPAIDDLSWTCFVPACTPTASIASFLPTSGPAGTMVTIIGTGFTGATDVKFGTVDATSFTVIDDNTITAEVPAGIGSSETISIFDAGACEEVSTGTYSLTTLSGSCSAYPGYTDLFISEIYDSESNNVWNIELYNPTPNPITLTGVYQIKRAGDISDPANYSRTIDLIGIVPANSVFTISAGNSTQTCGGFSFDFTESGGGINEKDVIALFKNGSLVDVSEAPNETGYSLLRNISSGVTAPSSTYISGDWTINLTEDCSDLGVFNLPPSSSIVINTQPADITGCSLTMSVTSPTPGITYQWKFNNPANMAGWLDVNSTNIPVAIIAGETSSTLTITGDVSALMDFQFYCELTESGCSILSNAAQFKIDARPIYRSVAASNGNWSTVSNWEMSTDYTNYVAACSYPRSINSSEVIIQTGTRIVLDLTGASAVDIDQVTVENNATLELLPDAKLTIYDSVAGADLLVDGTLYDRGDAFNGLDLVGSTSWELGANGTIIKSNNASVALYKDKYEVGMSTIPATANWIYRYNADGIPIVGTIDFFYPNLAFENTTASNFSWDNPVNTAFQGNTGFATVKGDFNIGVTGTSTCQVSNVNFNAQPMLLLGNLEIATGSSLNTNISSNYGTGFELKGNLIVDGALRILDGTIEERVLRFTGTTNQTVSGTGTIDLYKMTVNKTSGDVVLNRNLQAQNELVMTSGNILTNASLLELGLSTVQKGILNHTSGYVVGKMRRWFDGTNSGNPTGLYPMGFTDLIIASGLKNRHAKIEFTNAPTSGGHLTVEYIGTPMGLDGIPIPAANTGGAGFDVTTTEDQGYWKIDNETGKLTDGNYTIACTGEGYQTIANLAQLTLLKRVVANSPDWFCPGVHIATSGTIAMPTVSRSGVSDWSNFGFGGTNANPLPVKLIAFNLACDENQININWTTASELNSSHFVVEKSRDLKNWTMVSQIQAAGNSNQIINYNSSDLNGSNGVFYYRLKQVDYNGESEIYGPISVSCESNNNDMVVYPNPSNGDFTVEITWIQSNTAAQIQVIDLTGKIIQELDLNLNTGITQVEFNDENLQMGMYLIHLVDEKKIGLKPIRLVITK